ncbi:MAG: hypothetical protein AMXMBFR33_19770 [Candidatus Xenobia bacterium]|jgi:hypothetical protein
MVRRWVLLLLLLTGLARANVVIDDGTVQVGDPDAQGSTAPVVSVSQSPGAPPAEVPDSGSAGVSTPSGSTGSSGGGGLSSGGATSPQTTGQEDQPDALDQPMPSQNPYTLIAVGILLLLLALLGGAYFYRNRDREEPSE